MVFFAARAKNGLAVNRQMQNILMPFTNARAAYRSTLHAGLLAGGTKRAASFRVPENQWIFISGYEHKHRRKKILVMGRFTEGRFTKTGGFACSPGIHMCDLKQAAIFGSTLPAWKTEREILSPSQRGWMYVRHLVWWGGSSANNQNKVWDFDTISLQS